MDAFTLAVALIGGFIMPFSYLVAVIDDKLAKRKRKPQFYIGPNPRPRITGSVYIPREVQEEIDQTPRWWDKQFHKLVATVEPRRVLREPFLIEEITFLNGAQTVIGREFFDYPSCICERCQTMRLECGEGRHD